MFVSLQESLGSLRINVEFGKKPELQVFRMGALVTRGVTRQ